MVERNIDSRKHRKSTHLASADLDAMVLEKKDLLFEITDVRYETGVDVSGNKTDAYFVKFNSHKKEMVLNSVNRKTISDLASIAGFDQREKYNIGNWIGLEIELYVDREVKMMGKTVDGIRVKDKPPTPITEKDIKLIKAKVATILDAPSLNQYYASLKPKEKTNKDVMTILKERQTEIKES
tara:strand:- start:2256 stop:2801 length:546 start_codon:yes stop_codon:yes gene_type:complete